MTEKPLEQIKPLYTPEVNQPIFGWQIAKAPQGPLTAADTFVFSVTALTQAEVDMINNLRARVNELEDALQNLNLIK